MSCFVADLTFDSISYTTLIPDTRFSLILGDSGPLQRSRAVLLPVFLATAGADVHFLVLVDRVDVITQ